MKTTYDHEQIRLWAEAHHGRPEIVDDSHGKVLRIDFPGKRDNAYLGENLGEKRISWEDFFTEFENQELAFEYNPEISEDLDNDYRFIKRSFV